MRVLLIYNPRSGAARGEALAGDLAGPLARDGFEVELAPVTGDWRAGLAGAAALLVAGGDGSVLHALDAAIEARVPLYHVPTGNENLFAREFGHRADPRSVAAALRAGRVAWVDVGRATTADGWTSRFTMMCSLGPDASVVHRLEATRPRGGGHLVYTRPVLAELVRPALHPLRVTVDGRRLVDGERGVLVVANGRQYALRINPAKDASMTDGLLDAVFLPARTRAEVVLWGAVCAAGYQGDARDVGRARGREVVIEPLDGPVVAQMEGELVRGAIAPGKPLVVTVEPRMLPVLVAPPENV